MTGTRGEPAGRRRKREIRERRARLRAARRSRQRAERRRRMEVPSSAEARRRSRARWRRVWGAGAALLGVALVLAGALSLLEVRGTRDTARAYRAAEPCPDEATARHEDCLRELPATVRRTTAEHSGRSTTTYVVKLDGPRPAPAELTFRNPDRLVDDLRPGDEVTVTLWRGRATAVSRGGETQASTGTPSDKPESSLALALAFLAAGLYGICAGVVVMRRARGELPESLAVGGAATWGAMAAALPAVGYGYLIGGPVAVVAVWLVMVLVLIWFARRETGA